MTAKPARSEFQGNDRFIIESTLGQGGMGVVYRARDLHRSSVVALKTMTRLDPAALLLFKKEFRALADIAHPSVVQLYDLFAEGDQWFFTMELLEGNDFVSYVREAAPAPMATASVSATRTELDGAGRQLDGDAQLTQLVSVRPDGTRSSLRAIPNSGKPVGNEARLRRALLGLLDGVLAIHASGHLHRDIKPSNVMVTPEARVVLLDFGVVGELAKGHERFEEVRGTPAYMAPERAMGSQGGPAADFYAVGVMLYRALTGQLPFSGSVSQLLHAKQEARARPPSEVVDGVPGDLERLCMDLLEPVPEARPDGGEIMARLRAGQPQLRPRARSPSVSSMTAASAAFVGRELELSVLRQGVGHIAQREGVLTLVSGASGIGKTTLIRHFLEEAIQTPRALVLSGRCYEREAVPFKGLDSVVDELSRWLMRVPPPELARLLPANAAELLRVFPVLRGVPALEEQGWLWPEVKEPQELRRRAFMALRSLLVAIAKDRPLVLHIDDLHWTDVDSVALLEQVLHPPGAPSMLLVGSFRSEAIGKSPALGALLAMAERLSSSARVERIELTRLTYEDSARLAALSLGVSAEASPEAVRRIAEESQGLPLFVSELSTWQRTSAPDDGASGLISLDAVIRGRVDQLPREGQALLEVLCIAGGPLPTKVAEEVAGLSDADSLRARLRVAKLTRSVGSGDRELVDIYHGRIRDSLMGRIVGQRQRALHSRLASALESRGNADEGALVEHFLAAGDEAGARRHVLAAAEAAATGLAFLRAAGLYRQAIELRVALPRWQLERSEGDALLSAGHAAEAAAAFASAVHHAPRTERTALRRKAAEHCLKTGGETEGLRLLREALDDVELDYPETAASALASLSRNRELLRRRGLDFETRQSAPPAELERIDVAFAASSGLAAFDVIRAADFGARHLILALDGGEPIRICRALAIEASGRAAVEVERGQIEELVRAAERLALLSDDSYAVALAQLAAGLVRMFSGEWRAAHTTLDAAEQTMRERCRGVHWELANAVAWSMNALVLCGELKQAAQRVPEAVREAQERADRFALMHLIYPAAMTAIVADDPDTAMRSAGDFPSSGSELEGRCTGGHWGSLMARVSAHRYRGQGRQAHREMEVDYERLESAHFLRVHMLRVCTTFERALCALSAVEDGADERPALLRLADDCASELLADSPAYAAPMAHHVLAGLHALEGDRDQALERLDLAIAGLSCCDMGYLANCAKARRGALGGGDAGQQLWQASTERLREQGIVNVERCLDMSAPGFSRS